jgi:transposase-like protein
LSIGASHSRIGVRIRTTNMLERLFGEERRRTKVIPLAFGERVVLKSFLHGFEYGPRF